MKDHARDEGDEGGGLGQAQFLDRLFLTNFANLAGAELGRNFHDGIVDHTAEANAERRLEEQQQEGTARKREASPVRAGP